jgi:phosphonoacetaldehyde dehydrogenase
VKVPNEWLAPPCLVGGEALLGAQSLPVEYPYTGEVIGAAPLLGRDEVHRSLDLAAASRVALDRYERAQILERVAGSLAADREALAHLITLESGLCLADTRHEVTRAEDVFRAAAAAALHDDGRAYAGDVAANRRARRGYTLREPVRLIAAITPFNHPLNQVAHKVAPAVAAGAPLVLKPSEKTPLAGLWLASAVLDAGYPADALSVVTAPKELVLDAFLDHDHVEVLAFTGGADVGWMIAGRLGFRRAVLELGGNDPLLVLADADLDRASELAVRGATANSGQRCTAVKRIVAEHSVADDLAERICRRVGGLVVGDPFAEETDVGTLIDEPAAELVEHRVLAAVGEGARLLAGGDRRGAQLVPPVLGDVRPDSEIVREETFGPAVPIIRVRDLDEMLKVANGTRYGLSAGVVSNDLAAITRCIRELRCGTVNVGEVPGYRTELTPFGGVKDSGLGVKEGVLGAIEAYTTVKLFTVPWPGA